VVDHFVENPKAVWHYTNGVTYEPQGLWGAKSFMG